MRLIGILGGFVSGFLKVVLLSVAVIAVLLWFFR